MNQNASKAVGYMGRLTSILDTTKGKTLNGATYVQFRYHQGLRASSSVFKGLASLMLTFFKIDGDTLKAIKPCIVNFDI